MPDDNSILPCFKCGKQIHFLASTQEIRNALVFHTYGGYGSEVYDPFPNNTSSRKLLRIHICDDCITLGGELGEVLEGTIVKQPQKVTYKKWAREEHLERTLCLAVKAARTSSRNLNHGASKPTLVTQAGPWKRNARTRKGQGTARPARCAMAAGRSGPPPDPFELVFDWNKPESQSVPPL